MTPTPNPFVTFIKDNVVLWIVLALLAGLALLAVQTTAVSGVYLLAVVLALSSGVALLGGVVLGSPVPNAKTAPHLIFVLAVEGLMVAMALENVWSSAQVQYVVAAVIGGGLAGFGSTLTTSSPSSSSSSAMMVIDHASPAPVPAKEPWQPSWSTPPEPLPVVIPVAPVVPVVPVAPPAPGV